MKEPSWRATDLIAVVLTFIFALAVAGCGSSSSEDQKGGTSSGSSSSGPVGPSEADPAVAKLVPDSVKSKGTLLAATDATYPPDEFIDEDGETIVGFNPEIGVAMAAKMGLKIKIVNVPFDSIIPGLAARKYDLAVSSHTDTKERQQAVDFVDYYGGGSTFLVASSGGPAINGLADLCGHKVAVEKGSNHADDAAAQSKKCTAGGESAVEILTFPDQNAVNLALSSRRAEIGIADSQVASYLVQKSGGQFKLTGDVYGEAPHGIALPKGSELTQAVLAALKAIMEDGSYDRILEKWGVSDVAIEEPKINSATE